MITKSREQGVFGNFDVMELSDKQLRFIHSRKKLISYGKYLVVFLGILFVAFLGWMYYRVPLLINPYEVISRLESSSLDKNTMILMAGMLPIMVLIALFLLGVLIIFLIIAMSNEQRYIEIIDLVTDRKIENAKKM